MNQRLTHPFICAVVALCIPLSACDRDKQEPAADKATATTVAKVDGQRIIKANAEPGNWMSHGRTYDEQRYSPLKQIHADNVKELGLSWQYKLDHDRGTEATALVIDGVMYTTGAWSVVYALDARTGELLWKYDPQVSGAHAGRGCCGVVNRGVAAWDGLLYLGAYDGRLIALNAETGQEVWSKVTVDQKRNYTITGAPRVINGMVIIGNGGAELGVRGYISAYDAKTGEQIWRFYTVPGDPAKPQESEALEMAAKTWHGNDWVEHGGGGTVWDSMAYDPELDLLYIGTGNGSPWNIKYRSEGKGDNLFLSSIVALKPATGEYQWHYQTTPGDTWDFTATQHIILADMKIDGKDRKVLMQAPKNGFFYVLDRTNGELISANNFVPMNWATGIDMETGKPIKSPDGDFSSEPKVVFPSPLGAHNWQPMSYNPDTGLVYIPAQESFILHADLGQKPAQALNLWNLGVAPFDLPEDENELAKLGQQVKGSLLAWDPVKQQAAWSAEYIAPWNGGTLSTAGNLVFQGTADGRVAAYAADSGKLLWESPANTGVMAAPMTYEVDGEQYVTFMAGWGGAFPLVLSGLEPDIKVQAEARILTYKLGGKESLPAPQHEPIAIPTPPELTADAEQLATGKYLYHGFCAVCHGVSAISGSVTPDLRYMKPETHDMFAAIVSGARANKGMPIFSHLVTPDQIDLIHQYVIKRSHDLVERSAKATSE
ncbi:MAG: PQQ-dependent dehydrogenase, methanol/ethanol family [Nevskiales bacterium]